MGPAQTCAPITDAASSWVARWASGRDWAELFEVTDGMVLHCIVGHVVAKDDARAAFKKHPVRRLGFEDAFDTFDKGIRL